MPSPHPLENLSKRLKPDLVKVNHIILDRMQSHVPLIPELAGHLIAAGGKRIRPLLTLAAAALFEYSGNRQCHLAACVEFIHTATLLHDDVVDASNQRRGRASANALFGNEAAVLVGDFLFSRAFQLMVEDGSLDVLRILSNASAIIAEGEVLQLSIAHDLKTTEDLYFQVIRAKTAALFAAACEVGGVVAERSAAECRALYDYGMALGVCFQISDDVLDYQASEDRLGKSLGDDFKEGKMTLPLLKAIHQSTPEELQFWHKCLHEPQEAGDFAKALDIMNKYNSLEQSIKTAHQYAAAGRDALKSLPYSPLRQDMEDLITFVLERDC